jgi:Putative Zn-dependent protease, contains TPR repeats
MLRGYLIGGCLVASLWAQSPTLDQATKLYNRTDYEGSLRLLIAGTEKDARVYDLIGRNQFMLGEFKKASESYQQAVAADPSNSEYEHWLGKSLGKRAETASPFTAPGLASKARQHFEKAVALNPRNKDAVNDLFEYYMDAPGFLGGGLDKAATVAESIAALDRAEGLWAQSRIAERRKDYGKAEEQLRRAMQAAPQQVGRIVDLAKFLSKQGRIEESEQTFQAAERIAPNSPRLLYTRAETYIKAGRNIATARELLKRYLAANLSPDDPSRQDAEKLLRQAGS